MYKVSRYLVISDRAYSDENGRLVRLLFATRTASQLFVPPRIADALQEGRAEAVPPSMVTLLRDMEILVPADEDELTSILSRNSAAQEDPSTVNFILLPTSYCNMGCEYCGQQHLRGSLPSSHREAVRARVSGMLRRPEIRNAQIDWFGAEPMMGFAVLRDLAESFVVAAEEYGVEYHSTIVTNGSLLNARNLDQLVRRCRVDQFDLTLDGPPEIHDVRRPLKSGAGSFDRIVRTIGHAARHPDYQHVAFSFRTNIGKHNVHAIPRYLKLMAEAGFSRPNISFVLARIRPWSNDVSGMEVDVRQFAELEADWLGQMQVLGLNSPVLPTTAKRITCPAVNRHAELISSTGNIFSCTDHPLVPESERDLALGHVTDLGLPVFRPRGQFDDWNEQVRDGRVSGCSRCVFLATCGGSCPKAWHEGNAPCPGYKYNIQARMDLVASRCQLTPAS